jgi:hypothetical protein
MTLTRVRAIRGRGQGSSSLRARVNELIAGGASAVAMRASADGLDRPGFGG